MDITQNLNNFVDKINSTPRIQPLLKNWKRTIFLEIDDHKSFFISFNEHKAELVTKDNLKEYKSISMKSSLSLANEVFSGELTPMEAYLNGDLDVEASDEDQTKLDAISLVIWGD